MYKRYSPPKNFNSTNSNNMNNSALNNYKGSGYSSHGGHTQPQTENQNVRTERNFRNMPKPKNTRYTPPTQNMQNTQNSRNNRSGFENTDFRNVNTDSVKNSNPEKHPLTNRQTGKFPNSHFENINESNKKNKDIGCNDKVNSIKDKHEHIDEKFGIDIKEIINSILRFVPTSVYNPKSKKFFGMIELEDLLLIMLIFLLAENEDDGDPLLIYALLYLLAPNI